jgi:GT2 family glycosyltransferase
MRSHLHTPYFSVVIPTHARPVALRACLEGIARLECDQSFEVVVVDDGSPTPPDRVVEAFDGRLDIAFAAQPRSGPGCARNHGASIARGRFLAFIDDDCVPASSWLAALARVFDDDPDPLLGGQVVNALPENPYSTTTQLIMTYVYDYYDGRPDAERFFTTNNFALARHQFDAMGGFDTSIPSHTAEDKDFCERWRHAGRRMSYIPDAVVYHEHHLTLNRFLRQHYNYGRGILSFRRLSAQRRDAPLLPEPVSFYGNMLLFPYRHPSVQRRTSCAFLIALSQVATAAGALKSALLDTPEAETVHRVPVQHTDSR